MRNTGISFAIAGALTAALVMTTPVSAADDKAAETKDPVVAVVNGENITASEINEARSRLPQQYQQLPVQVVFTVLLDSVIDSRLVANAARAANTAEDPVYQRALKRIENQLLEQVYLSRYLESKVTDAAQQVRYLEMLHAAKGKQEVQARHILVEKEEDAKALIAELDKGAEFEKLAKERSIGPSASKGGDLGFFGEGDMVPEFSKAAFAMDKGAHSKAPVKIQFGWHVIKVVDKREVAPPEFAAVQGQIQQELATKARADLTKDLRAKATIEKYNLDGSKPEAKKEEEKKE